MRHVVLYVIVFSWWFLPTYSLAQSSQVKTTYEQCIADVQKLRKANLMAEALVEIDKAISKARTPDEKLDAITIKGEIHRASEAHQLALETLWSAHPKLLEKASVQSRLKHLGRLAAVHQEYGAIRATSPADSAYIYIDSALRLAQTAPEQNQLEIASLYNEIGLYVYRKGNTPDARDYFKKSCKIFKELGEDEMLVTPMSNLLELESCALNTKKADSLMVDLENLIEGKDWFRVKALAYNSLAIASRVKGDEIGNLIYERKMLDNTYRNQLRINSEKMLVLREIYERDKLKQEVRIQRDQNEKKKKQLEIVDTNRKRLLLFLVLAVLVAASVVALLLRERILKKRIKNINENLNELNERYELLVIESNHRIKNNLQMVQALLDYTKKGVDDSGSKVIRSISGKINTISALHKFLYSRDHNEDISLQMYFEEIERLYQNIAPRNFQMKLDLENIQIGSERIVYFGLILNEMLSNTVEHAPDKVDQIEVSVKKSGNDWRFTYVDQSRRSDESTSGTGTQLIQNLIQHLGGSNFQFDPDCGKYQFDFAIKPKRN